MYLADIEPVDRVTGMMSAMGEEIAQRSGRNVVRYHVRRSRKQLLCDSDLT